MKILEVTGFGNKEKHLIPLNNIICFHFDERYTSIILAGGNKVNVIEIESTIKEMFTSISIFFPQYTEWE